VLGEHPNGGPVSVRPGRFGAYVNWGKVNATIPKSVSPDEISLGEAVDLIEEKEGRPAGPRAARKTAKPIRKPLAQAGAAKKAAGSSAPPFEPDAKAKAGSTSAKSSTLKAQARPAGKPARAKRKA